MNSSLFCGTSRDQVCLIPEHDIHFAEIAGTLPIAFLALEACWSSLVALITLFSMGREAW